MLLCSTTALSQIYVRETENLRLITLDRAHAYLVPHAAASFENSLKFHRTLFQYTPTEKVTVLLHDFNDYGTGGTNTIPWNFLSIGVEPYDYVYETAPTNERLNWVMNHELVHVLATDKATGVDNTFRGLFFGKVTPVADNPLTMAYSALTSPRWYSPRWYHEGIAVFMETWMSGGIGRALGAYDEMVFRTMVADSSYFYDYVGLESEGTTIDFQIGANAYLYGTRFVSYLALMQGPEKLLAWFNRTPDSHRTYASQFEAVYGRSLGSAWRSWIAWEHSWQHANLDSVHRNAVTPMRPIVRESLGSVSRPFVDRGRGELYVAMNRPGQLAAIAAINLSDGNVRTLCDVPSPALYYVCSTAYDSASGTLFYTTHNSASWRDLWSVDVRTGETTELIDKGRIGDLAFNRADRSLWGVQHHNGYSTVVRIMPPYMQWQDILPLKYGRDLYDLDVSPDGRMLTAAMAEISGRQRLISLHIDSLLAGSMAYDVLYEFPDNAPMNFVFSPDGRFMFGSTYQTGVANLVRYDVNAKTMQWISNVETGLFRPAQFGRDSVLAFRYTGKGFLPVVVPAQVREDVSPIVYLGQAVVEKYPVLTQWKIPPPSSVNIDSLTIHEGEYNAWSELSVASAYPVIEGYKVYTSAGIRANLLDPLGVAGITVTASVSPARSIPNDERFHAAAELRWWQWRLNATYNAADFYDLFGPTKTSRKGYSAGLRYSDYLIFERPKTLEVVIAATAFTGLDRLPDYQNIAVSFDRFATLNGRLSFVNVRRSLGAVDNESGMAASLNSLNSLVRGEFIPRVYGTLDAGLPLPVDHSSLWLRLAGGWGGGGRDDVFGGFFFGGFGNNWVDQHEPQRYREYYSFPGTELNSIGGTSFARVTGEWTLPPLRFREFGIPAFYCTWMRSALFATVLSANIDAPAVRTNALSAGAQVDFKLVLFSHLNSMLSLGYAAAAAEHARATREFMISLKLL
jgi:hypothetical protein